MGNFKGPWPANNSNAARHVARGEKYGSILCVPLLELWVWPATKMATVFWPVVVKRLPTTDLKDGHKRNAGRLWIAVMKKIEPLIWLPLVVYYNAKLLSISYLLGIAQ